MWKTGFALVISLLAAVDELRAQRLPARYRPEPLAPGRWQDSPRLESLLRAGNLYLSVQDAIALAVENNLDVELQRYTPRIAETDELRARAGGFLRGLPLNVREGPAGVGGPRIPDVGSVTGAAGAGTPPPVDSLFGAGPGAVFVGPTALSNGPLIPSLDPALVGALGWNRSNRPQANTFVSGTNALQSTNVTGDLRLQQGFLTGGLLSVGYDADRLSANNRRQDINPSLTSGASLTFTQPLLEGFGVGVNRRFIRIARNNLRVAGLAFEQQLVGTVYAVTRLYWDLVGLQGDVQVKRQSLELVERLLAENQEQERAGVVAPIEVVRARAEVARGRRDVTIAETLVRQQETVLKDFLSRRTVDSPVLRPVRVIPTDSIPPPTDVPIEPLQDLVAKAVRKRPDVAQAALQLDSSEIGLAGSRSTLLPTLDLVVNARSSGLTGQTNPLPQISTGGTGAPGQPFDRQPDPAFLGGFGTGLSQVFSGRFPDYGAQLQLNIPILNRAARADYTRDQLIVRQQEIRLRQLEKQVRVDIVNALIAVEQAAAAYRAAEQARVLQEETLAAEREKLAAGVSTTYVVIQFQRDLAQARSAEVVALGDYAQARNALDRATGTILDTYGVSVDAALRQ